MQYNNTRVPKSRHYRKVPVGMNTSFTDHDNSFRRLDMFIYRKLQTDKFTVQGQHHPEHQEGIIPVKISILPIKKGLTHISKIVKENY
jgi:hypothetical protein